jgi:hypothetical protein
VTNVDLDPDIVSSSREDLTITVNVYDPAYFGAEQFAHGDRCWVVTLPAELIERRRYAIDACGDIDMQIGIAADGSVRACGEDEELTVEALKAVVHAIECNDVRKLLEAWDVELAESAAG